MIPYHTILYYIIDPGSIQDRSRIDPGSILDRSRTDVQQLRKKRPRGSKTAPIWSKSSPGGFWGGPGAGQGAKHRPKVDIGGFEKY